MALSEPQLPDVQHPFGSTPSVPGTSCRTVSGRMWGRTTATGAQSPLLGSTGARHSRWRACPCPVSRGQLPAAAALGAPQMSRQAPPAASPTPAWTMLASQGSLLLAPLLGSTSLSHYTQILTNAACASHMPCMLKPDPTSYATIDRGCQTCLGDLAINTAVRGLRCLP